MKSSTWILVIVALLPTAARGQTEIPSPTAEPGRLEAPQPEPPSGNRPAAGDAAVQQPAPKSSVPAQPPVPAGSSTAVRWLGTRKLEGGGQQFGLPLLRGSGWQNGLPGWLDLSVGFSAGRQNTWDNVALNTQLEFAPGLRGHFTGVYRQRQHRATSDRSIQEGYLEGFGFTPALQGRLGYNLRLGRTVNLGWPYPDPLSLSDYLPFRESDPDGRFAGYEHLTGVADWEHATGFGLHAALTRRISRASRGRGDLDVHMIDYYGRYRQSFGDGFNTELRLGGLNPRTGFTDGLNPRSATLGGSLYLGKDWTRGSAGLLIERLDSESTRFGLSVSLAPERVTGAIGHVLGRYQRSHRVVTAQVPVAQVWLGQRLQYEPPLFAEKVGQVDATRLYRTGMELPRDAYPLNYEYILNQTGMTRGSGLIRVVREGPRALNEFGLADGRDIPKAEDAGRFRQDVTYEVYRAPKLAQAALRVRLVNKLKPGQAVPNATVAAVDQVGRKQAFTAGDGTFTYAAPVPVDRPQKATLRISAPGFLPETAEVQLSAGDPKPLEIAIRPAIGAVAGSLTDATTGSPIPEVEVVVTGGGRQPQVVLTDEKGRFEADDLPPGRYTITSHAPRFRDERFPVEVGPGERKQVEFKLGSRPASVAGRLLRQDGRPVADAAVTLRNATGGAVAQYTTLADGSFGGTGLKPGAYTVQAKAGAGRGVDTTIQLSGGEIGSVELRLP